MLIGGEVCHYGGEFRPLMIYYLPLADFHLAFITLSPLAHCRLPSLRLVLEVLFRDLLSSRDGPKPIFEMARGNDGKGVAHDVDGAIRMIEKLQEVDAAEGRGKLLVIIANEASSLDVVEFFPA